MRVPEPLLKFHNLRSAVVTIGVEIGHIPSKTYLERKHPEVAAAIVHHGGYEALREKHADALREAINHNVRANDKIAQHIGPALAGNKHSLEEVGKLLVKPATRIAARVYDRHLRNHQGEYAHIEHADLVAAGMARVYNTLREYDVKKPSGASFSSWAHHKMSSGMLHYVRDHSQGIREPAWFQEVKPTIIDAYSKLEKENPKKTPDLDEVARMANVTAETVLHALKFTQPSSLDHEQPSLFKEEGEPWEVAYHPPEYRKVELRMAYDLARKQGLKVSEKQENALTLWAEGHTYTEIGRIMGHSTSYARLLVVNTMERIVSNELIKREFGLK